MFKRKFYLQAFGLFFFFFLFTAMRKHEKSNKIDFYSLEFVNIVIKKARFRLRDITECIPFTLMKYLSTEALAISPVTVTRGSAIPFGYEKKLEERVCIRQIKQVIIKMMKNLKTRKADL